MQYHVTLDGQGYLIDLASYRKGVASPFAPKQRQGDPDYGDLALASVWAQESWRGGLGYETFDPKLPDRYDEGVSIDPTLGDLRLGRSLTSVFNPGASVTDIWAILPYRGALYAIRGDGGEIYTSSDGSSWSTALSSGKSSLRSIALFNGWLIVGSGSDGDLIKYDGSVWTNPWVSLAGVAVRSLQSWAPSGSTESLYCGVSQSGNRSALVRVTTAGAATTLHQPQLDHVDAIGIADNQLWYCALSETQGVRGELFATDATTWEHIVSIPDNAITAFALYRGVLYAGSRTRGKIWAVSDRGLAEVWTIPDVVGIGGVSTYAQPIRALVVDNDRLHVPAVDAQGLGTYVYDGVGWSLPNTGGLGQEARGLAAFGGNLYLTMKSTGGARIYRVDSQHATSGVVVTSWFDAELAATDKVWVRLSLAHAALASGQSVTVDYALDGSGVWTNLGVSNTVGATAKTLSFPTATAGKRLRLRLTLAVSGQTATPQVAGVLVEYLTMPDLKAEWRFDALLEGTAALPLVLLDQAIESKTGVQLADTLWTSKAKKQTLSFTDLDGEAKTVLFQDLEERVAQLSQRQGLSTRGRVTLVEA